MGLMQRRDINILAAFLQHADRPVRPQPRHQRCGIDGAQIDLTGKPIHQSVAPGRILRPADMKRAAWRQEAAVVEVGIGIRQIRA